MIKNIIIINFLHLIITCKWMSEFVCYCNKNFQNVPSMALRWSIYNDNDEVLVVMKAMIILKNWSKMPWRLRLNCCCVAYICSNIIIIFLCLSEGCWRCSKRFITGSGWCLRSRTMPPTFTTRGRTCDPCESTSCWWSEITTGPLRTTSFTRTSAQMLESVESL